MGENPGKTGCSNSGYCVECPPGLGIGNPGAADQFSASLVARVSQRVQISAWGQAVVCVGALGAHASQGSSRLTRLWFATRRSEPARVTRACVSCRVVLVGHAAVPGDGWALPGQSSDCLRTRAWPASTCWPAHSAQLVPELINYQGLQQACTCRALLQSRLQSVL